ncbi:MAG TPA: hypothetical protein VGC51_14425 [Hansschlegelia sp.]
MRRLLLAAAIALLAPAGAGLAQVRSVETYGPRPFGVLLGDVLKLRSVVVVDAPFKLDRSTLPQPGAVTYSLELHKIDVTEEPAPDNGTRYRIETEYQTFFSALETGEQTIPAYTIAVSDGTRREEVQAGKWTYVTSPLRPIQGQAGESNLRLRPDVRPAIPSTRAARIQLGAALALVALLFCALAWQRSWWPFHRRASRPFGAAAREIGRLAGRGEEGRRAALLRLHRAFDVAWGKRLLGDDIGAFLRDRPAFARHGEAIRSFFEASRAAFFGPAGATASIAPDTLTRLARDLASAERAS